jgi:hypothetical protein
VNWRRFFHKEDTAADLRSELGSYLDHATDEFMARGMDEQAARSAAHRKLGNQTHVSEEIYHMDTISFLEETARNIRFSARILRKNPTFAGAAILTLAIGIGANTAVFSVVDGVLLKPLAYRDPERLVSIRNVAPGLGGVTAETGLGLSTGMYFTFSEQNRSFENMGVWTPSKVSVSGVGEPEQVLSIAVSSGTLEALGVRPRWGAGFRPRIRNPARRPQSC